jgi:hypothetical protein
VETTIHRNSRAFKILEKAKYIRLFQDGFDKGLVNLDLVKVYNDNPNTKLISKSDKFWPIFILFDDEKRYEFNI